MDILIDFHSRIVASCVLFLKIKETILSLRIGIKMVINIRLLVHPSTELVLMKIVLPIVLQNIVL